MIKEEVQITVAIGEIKRINTDHINKTIEKWKQKLLTRAISQGSSFLFPVLYYEPANRSNGGENIREVTLVEVSQIVSHLP